MDSKERAFALMMSSLKTYIEDYIEQKIEEIANRVLNKLRQDDKGIQTTAYLPLKEWISTEYKRHYNPNAKPQGQRGLWKAVLLPYVAAKLASLVPEYTHEEFVEMYDIPVDRNIYSFWTKNYFSYTKIKDEGLYNRENLIFWWKNYFHLSETEIDGILKDLENRLLL